MSKKLFAPTAVFLAALLMSACGADTAERNAADNATLFHSDPDGAKVFFYVVYNHPEDKPYLHETFRFYIDGSYMNDIRDDQFIEVKVTPDDHQFSVHEIGWGGNTVTTATLKAKTAPGQLLFTTGHVLPDDKAELTITDPSVGKENVESRARVCICR